jgi:hypothetical protein
MKAPAELKTILGSRPTTPGADFDPSGQRVM